MSQMGTVGSGSQEVAPTDWRVTNLGMGLDLQGHALHMECFLVLQVI